MDCNFQGLLRMTNVTRLFTVLLLTAVGAAFLVPLSATSTKRPTAAPIGARGHVSTHTTTSLPLAPTTTVPTTTTTPTTVAPAATPTTPPAPAPAAGGGPDAAATSNVNGYGCGPALAYLQAHAAPGFTFECPGYAQGHQAMTCDNVAGVCPGAMVIAISTPCPAAYMNEASNSWVVSGKSNAALDPYGYCQ